MPLTIAFFGLGDIGAPMAGRLAADGHRLLVKNRSEGKTRAWLQENEGTELVAISDIADTDVVVSCVGNDGDLEALYLGEDGIAAHVGEGVLVIDHTTASAGIARRLNEALTQAGASFVDAPVSGGSAGARNGVLSVMVGGDEGPVERAQPVLASYSRTVSHVGEAGSGQLCKMVNQLCIAGVLEGLAEGLALARAAGLEPERVLRAISGGAAASWQMENRSSFMLEDNYPAGFAARLMLKDLGLCLDEARRLEVSAPVAQAVSSQYERLIAQGLGDEDFSNLHRLTLPDAG